MKKLIVLCTILCLFTLTACDLSKEVKPLTDEDIKTYSSEMSKDPFSGDITLNGIKYTLPIKAQSLVDNKWFYSDYNDKGQPLKNGYYIDSIYMDDGLKSEDTRITVTLYNTTGSTMDFADAMLGAIKINKYSDSYKNTVVLPKGITLTSTYDDVISAYGAPESDFMTKVGTIYYNSKGYTDKYGQKLIITFDTTTKVIKSIELQNIPQIKK